MYKYKYLFWKAVICLLILIMIPSVGMGEDNSEDTRPKVGLALGGGSALGLAHVGVLFWLEEHRIPVDYVSGTSMGGLIGGCYAMGMTPEEIKTLVTGIDWEELFDPKLPYDILDFRRKEDRRKFPMAAEMGLDLFGLKLPTGVFSYQVDLLLSRLTLPYSTVVDFNDLPVPFRCVATDVELAESVVLDKGSLIEAMRATMAIPGVFTPVFREGRVLVDGGLLNNVPADVAKEMGSEIVIAVEMIPPKPRDLSGVGVLLRTMNTVVAANGRRAHDIADLVITPDVADLTLMDWGKAVELIRRGYQAAEGQKEYLRTLSVDERTWSQYLKRRNERRRLIPIPDAVRIKGVNPNEEDRIKERFLQVLGKPLNTDLLETELLDLLGSGFYESFRYECIDEENTTVLVITAVPKAYGPSLITFAMEFESELLHDYGASLAVGSRATFLELQRGSELRVDLRLGKEPSLSAELYEPLLGAWFFAPTVFLQQQDLSIYEDEMRISDYRIIHGGLGFDLGYTLGKSAEVRCGYSADYQKTWLKVGTPIGFMSDGFVEKARLKWTYDQADDALLPLKGGNINFTNTWYFEAPGSPEPFGQSEIEYFWTFPVSENDFVITRLASGLTWEGDSPFIQEFRLGGPFRLGAYQEEKVHGDNYLLGSLGYLRRLKYPSLFGPDLYLGIWLDTGDTFNKWENMDHESVLSVGLVGTTLLGPVYCNLSFRQDDYPYLYIGVGRIF